MEAADPYTRDRQQMIQRQLIDRGITHPDILKAFSSIPRHKFIPQQYIDDAYIDAPVPIGFDQTISQPYIIAVMLEAVHPNKNHRVLDIGAGSGYQSALLSKLSQHVHAVERLQQLVNIATQNLANINTLNVTLHTADGSLGLPQHAPYDRIICAAASPRIPQPWIDQLNDPGIIVAPIGDCDSQRLVVYQQHHGQRTTHNLDSVRFVKLIGQFGFH